MITSHQTRRGGGDNLTEQQAISPPSQPAFGRPRNQSFRKVQYTAIQDALACHLRDPFPPDPPEALMPFAALSGMDEILGQLPKRDLDLVVLRFGGGGQPPAGVASIALSYRLSRERVRQIVFRSLMSLNRRGGAATKVQLDAIADFCRRSGCPLTPALLLTWTPKPWPLRYVPEFYVQVIGWLRRRGSPLAGENSWRRWQGENRCTVEEREG